MGNDEEKMKQNQERIEKEKKEKEKLEKSLKEKEKYAKELKKMIEDLKKGGGGGASVGWRGWRESSKYCKLPVYIMF